LRGSLIAQAPVHLLNRLAREDATVLAPRPMLEEVANALLSGVRRHRWDGTAADTAFQLLMTLPVEISEVPGDLERAWELSRRYDEHPVTVWAIARIATTNRSSARGARGVAVLVVHRSLSGHVIRILAMAASSGEVTHR
jgi:hypothetical protein